MTEDSPEYEVSTDAADVQPAADEPATTDDRSLGEKMFDQQMWSLVKSFPSTSEYLNEFPLPAMALPFNLSHFNDYVGDAIDAADRHAVEFIRAVHAGEDRSFNFIAAYRVWKPEDKAAFHRWCHSPFWPPGADPAMGKSGGRRRSPAS